MKTTQFYKKLNDLKVQCLLCPHTCILAKGKLGICGVRRNRGGDLVNETYEKVSSIHFDPIEKKPLYHFLPGSIILSIGSIGCNLKCSFCQNCEISQTTIDDFRWLNHYPVEEIVNIAIDKAGNTGLSYTYNEPTINYEYPDPELDLDYVPNHSRKLSVECVLSNSFGLGGQNACLVINRLEL